MVASGMCHLVIYFPKIYHSWEEGALITFVYIQIRLLYSSPSVFVQHFWRPGLLWLGGAQNRPAPKDDPCSIFLGVDLVFLRGEGLVEKLHYPFDLQVGPL